MSDVSIPIFFGVIPLLTLVVLHHILILFNKKSVKFRKFFNGRPIIVIDKNGIDYNALKSLNMTINDLNEGLRIAGCFDITNVAYAIVETNGNISVMLKSKYSPLTPNVIGFDNCEEDNLQVMLICEGTIIEENIEKLKLNKGNIEKLLKREKVEQKDVLLLATNDKKTAYIQCNEGKGKMIQLDGEK